jgi:hypothetical protein
MSAPLSILVSSLSIGFQRSRTTFLIAGSCFAFQFPEEWLGDTIQPIAHSSYNEKLWVAGLFESAAYLPA